VIILNNKYRHFTILKLPDIATLLVSVSYNEGNQKFGMENVGFTMISLYIPTRWYHASLAHEQICSNLSSHHLSLLILRI
jgi:hypothetical protein